MQDGVDVIQQVYGGEGFVVGFLFRGVTQAEAIGDGLDDGFVKVWFAGLLAAES